MVGISRSIGAVVSAATWLALAVAPGCGTDATGVGDCRAIERARCDAAEACGLLADAAECRRFYRDQCLHGLPVDSPGAPLVEACIAVIHRAGECARSGFSDCDADACSVVLRPELTDECAFLAPDAERPPAPGTGGSAGNDGNETAGAAGAEASGGASGG